MERPRAASAPSRALPGQVEHRHRQQQAGGKTDRERQPLARQAEHDQCRGSNAQNAAEQAGEDDLRQQGREDSRDMGCGIASGASVQASLFLKALFNHSSHLNATLLHLSCISCADPVGTRPSAGTLRTNKGLQHVPDGA